MNLQQFLDMGGYAAFVWPAYGIGLAVLVWNIWSARRAHTEAPLERCKTHPKSQYKHMVPDYKEIKIVDDYTVRFITKAPTPEALYMLENISIVPPQYFQEWDKKDYAHLTRNMVGTGPYKFVEWVKDDHVTLAANKEWWGKKVDFERVILRPIPENATRVAALITGEIDACWGVSIPDIPRVEKNKNTYVSRVPSQRAIYVMCDVFAEKGGPPPKDSPGLPTLAEAGAHVPSYLLPEGPLRISGAALS